MPVEYKIWELTSAEQKKFQDWDEPHPDRTHQHQRCPQPAHQPWSCGPADDRLVASFLAVRLRRTQTITEDQLSELLARFNKDQQRWLELFQISQSMQGLAVEVAHEHGLRAADSIHLATMIELHGAADVAGIQLLAMAADKALCDAAEREGLKVVNPENTEALTQLKEFIQLETSGEECA
jgi:predicted nucleic acid-binding protein